MTIESIPLEEQINILNELINRKSTVINQLEVDNIMLRRKLAKEEQKGSSSNNGVGDLIGVTSSDEKI